MEAPPVPTSRLRTISVGPVIGRLINKMMATRLGSLLVKNDVLNKAQWAFLPGLTIHGPISDIIETYRSSLQAENDSPHRALFAIYYDISKAYDTVRWSSIKRGLQRIGMSADFVAFAMNSLEGSKTSMRTGVDHPHGIRTQSNQTRLPTGPSPICHNDG
jgi:hypothetical protein